VHAPRAAQGEVAGAATPAAAGFSATMK
jgi:hypothetical protein